MQKNEWEKEASQLLQDLKNEISSLKGWTLVKQNADGISSVYKKIIPNNPSHMFKCVARLNAKPEKVFDYVASHEHDFDMEPGMIFGEAVEYITDDIQIWHEGMAPGYGMAHRDFTQLQVNSQDEEHLCRGSRSVSHPKCPIDPNFVRGHMYLTGCCVKFMKESTDDHPCCEYITVSQSDIKGWVPKFLTNSSFQADYFFKLVDHVRSKCEVTP